jgi:voltage-gated potassium channel
VVILLVVSIIFGAIGMLVVEEGNPDSTIKNFGDVIPITFEGRIISVILIIVGLTTILGFISSFGTTIVVKRLNNKVIAHDIKKSIKDRIDILEEIHASEVEALIDEINTLHKKIYNSEVACSKCGFLYPEESLYCNKCGEKIEL